MDPGGYYGQPTLSEQLHLTAQYDKEQEKPATSGKLAELLGGKEEPEKEAGG